MSLYSYQLLSVSFKFYLFNLLSGDPDKNVTDCKPTLISRSNESFCVPY